MQVEERERKRITRKNHREKKRRGADEEIAIDRDDWVKKARLGKRDEMG